jgi:hypothetical protein
MRLRRLEVNGGQVQEEPYWRLILPPTPKGYADAQIDDYGLDGVGRRHYPWLPGTRLELRARFSHNPDQLVGTAGFGFWNAPFADPDVRWPALPQAIWFFFASVPTDLPLALAGPGRGWFAATLDATSGSALAMIPLAPAALLLNQLDGLHRKIWPRIRRRLKISYAPVAHTMQDWHQYSLSWMPDGCSFLVDGAPVLNTPYSPGGPLGFVCWVDNQYLIATTRGRLGWGTLPTTAVQMLEVDDLSISRQALPGE